MRHRQSEELRHSQRLGFQFEGVLRQAQLLNGEYQDINIYSQLAGEWKSQPAVR